jgi:cytochrome c oxidase cbb3-type subunit 3
MSAKTSVMVMVFLPLSIFFCGTSQAVERGEDLYRTYCTQCHGSQGNGKGINVRDMSVQPRDHTDATAMSTRSDQDLAKVIKEGGLSINKSVLMPPWGDVFSEDEVDDLVHYLRKLCNCTHGQ